MAKIVRVVFCVALILLSFPFFPKFQILQSLFTAEELALCNGTDISLPIYLAILGFHGKLLGRYYDGRGNPTEYLKSAKEKAPRGVQLLAEQKIEEDNRTPCTSNWNEEHRRQIWCDAGYPRLFQSVEKSITRQTTKRCAGYKEDELKQPGLEVPDNLSNRCICDAYRNSCRYLAIFYI